MRKVALLATILTVGLAVSACDIKTSANGDFSFDIATGKATDTWSRTYKVADKGRFELINVNGRITAEATDGNEIVVEGARTAKARSDDAAKELLAQLEIKEEVSDSTVRVESCKTRLSLTVSTIADFGVLLSASGVMVCGRDAIASMKALFPS